MNDYPFSVFKRADRTIYSVAFKDEQGKYLPPVSTGKKTEKEAMQAAFEMLREGKRKNGKAVTVHGLSLKEAARKVRNAEEAETIMAELKRLGWVKSYVARGAPDSENFLEFLARFWDYDRSPYVQEKLRKAHGIHRRYCRCQTQAAAKYWAPRFEGRLLGELTGKDIGDFISSMAETGLSASRINMVVLAGTQPLRWAHSKGMIAEDPTRGHLMFSGTGAKRKILAPGAAAAAFRAEWKCGRARLGSLLAAVTGMRLGEIQALRLGDLGAASLSVRASWNPIDGVKTTKTNAARTVELNFPEIMDALREQAMRNPWGASPDSFVFWTEGASAAPMREKRFMAPFRAALESAGMTREEAGTYVFHGWRHFYATYMAGELDRKLLKSQTGHKTDKMLARYADHEAEGDREAIRSAQRRTFAGLLPATATA